MSALPFRTRAARGPQGPRLVFPAESPFFEGHFPGSPIVPGVALLAAVRALAVESDEPVGGLRGLRFRRPLLPGEEVELALDRSEERLRFQAGVGTERVAEGTFLFGADDSSAASAPASLGDRPGGPAAELIPQVEPARLLERVTRWGPEALEGIARIGSTSPFLSRPDLLTPLVALEMAAQLVAAHEPLRAAAATGAPPRARRGYLVGARDARFGPGSLAPGEEVRVAAFREAAAPPLLVHRVECRSADALVLEARLSTWAGA